GITAGDLTPAQSRTRPCRARRAAGRISALRCSAMASAHIEALVREVPNFPKPGIVFRDIPPLLREPKAFAEIIDVMSDFARKQSAEIVAAPESRGFIFAAAVALRAAIGFVPIRKPGKLPWKTRGASYALEYGTDRLEIHEDAIRSGQRVLLVDDVL